LAIRTGVQPEATKRKDTLSTASNFRC
jgi:hypothetical protein